MLADIGSVRVSQGCESLLMKRPFRFYNIGSLRLASALEDEGCHAVVGIPTDAGIKKVMFDFNWL